MKRLIKFIINSEMGLRERIFRVFLSLGMILTIIVIIENLMLLHTPEIFFTLVTLVVAWVLCIVLTFAFEKTNLAMYIIAVYVNLVLFPFMFMNAGGLESGGAIWFAFGLIYTLSMFDGKKLALMLFMNIAADLFYFWYFYKHADMITLFESAKLAYIDTLFSVLAVGIAGGLIVSFQRKVYENERLKNIKQKETLKEITESKNAFFANMSHEIRTPINTIIGLNEITLREKPTETIRENAENIEVASKMLLNLVNDILDLSQIEIKEMKIIPVEYKIESLIRELIDIIHVRIKEKKLDFFVDIDNDIPSVLFGDENRIKQVVLNILTNAVKYTIKGSITFSVSCKIVDNDNVRISLSVADTGIGIKKEDLEHIFEAFMRFDSKNNLKIEGVGLGLSIAKQLVDMMDGKIEIDSIYNKGSIFTVVLNQKIIDRTPIGEIDFKSRQKNDGELYYEHLFEAPEAKILIVDDNEMNLLVAKKLLSDTKVKIITALDSEECLHRTSERSFDLIFMDHMMRGMDGIETMEAVRKQKNGLCRETPIVVMTANNDPGAEEFYYDCGFDGYIAKPVIGQKMEEEMMKFLPEEIIEYKKVNSNALSEVENIKKLKKKRKKPFCITADSNCDIPSWLAEKYNIKIMNLYIRTKYGRFSDSYEIDSDSYIRCFSDDNDIYADSASVEEYEDFFSEILQEAEEIIHISLSSGCGITYSHAVSASKCFSHVNVIDSGHISGGEGLLVLKTAMKAMETSDVKELIEFAEETKKKINSYFVIPSLKKTYEGGYVGLFAKRFSESFRLIPCIKMKKGKLKLRSLKRGKIENIGKKFMDNLPRKNRMDNDIMFFTYVGLRNEDINIIKNELIKKYGIKEIIVNKTSVSNACNSGSGTISVSYLIK